MSVGFSSERRDTVMKLLSRSTSIDSLLAAFVGLSLLACSAIAQDDPFTEPPSVVYTMDNGKVIECTLPPGALSEVLDHLQTSFDYISAAESREFEPLPTLIYEPDVENTPIDVPIRLRVRDLTPIDGLALVIAAAHCQIQPIQPLSLEPPTPSGDSAFDGGSSTKDRARVIGYRISALHRKENPFRNDPDPFSSPRVSVMGMAVDPMPSRPELDLPQAKPEEDGFAGVGIVLGEAEGQVVIREILPSTPAAKSKVIQPGHKIVMLAEAKHDPVAIKGMALIQVAKLIRGEPGSLIELTLEDEDGAQYISELHRQSLRLSNLPIPVKLDKPVSTAQRIDPNYGFADSPIKVLPPINGNDVSAPGLPSKSEEPIVTVYPLGEHFADITPSAIEKKQAEFEALLQETLELAFPDRTTNPTLAFHATSGALVVKATPEEHALIQQVMDVMRENRTSADSGGF